MVEKNDSVPERSLRIRRRHARTFSLAFLMITALLNAQLSFVFGETPHNKQPAANSFQYYLELAEKGQIEAQVELGSMYLEGRGVQQSYQEALKWFRKAADAGNAAAQFNIGLMYAKGLGVPRDYDEAINWFTLAARQDFEPAKHILEALGIKP
jgi:uncharacterized protein